MSSILAICKSDGCKGEVVTKPTDRRVSKTPTAPSLQGYPNTLIRVQSKYCVKRKSASAVTPIPCTCVCPISLPILITPTCTYTT